MVRSTYMSIHYVVHRLTGIYFILSKIINFCPLSAPIFYYILLLLSYRLNKFNGKVVRYIQN